MSEERQPYDIALLSEYARLAQTYETRWASYVATTVEATLSRLHPVGQERILDVGCGTGALLAALAASSAVLSLAGVDPSPEMLRIARTRLGGTVDLREAWARQLPHDDGSFDAVVSSSAFHYFRDPGLVLAEMRRVLVPGGRIVVTDWCGDYLSSRLCGLSLRIRRRPFTRIYTSRQLARMMETVRFSGILVDRYRIDWLWGLMTVTASRP